MSADPCGNLNQSALNEIYGLLEPFEDFSQKGQGALYLAGSNTIAYGMNLLDTNSLGLVLNV